MTTPSDRPPPPRPPADSPPPPPPPPPIDVFGPPAPADSTVAQPSGPPDAAATTPNATVGVKTDVTTTQPSAINQQGRQYLKVGDNSVLNKDISVRVLEETSNAGIKRAGTGGDKTGGAGGAPDQDPNADAPTGGNTGADRSGNSVTQPGEDVVAVPAPTGTDASPVIDRTPAGQAAVLRPVEQINPVGQDSVLRLPEDDGKSKVDANGTQWYANGDNQWVGFTKDLHFVTAEGPIPPADVNPLSAAPRHAGNENRPIGTHSVLLPPEQVVPVGTDSVLQSREDDGRPKKDAEGTLWFPNGADKWVGFTKDLGLILATGATSPADLNPAPPTAPRGDAARLGTDESARASTRDALATLNGALEGCGLGATDYENGVRIGFVVQIIAGQLGALGGVASAAGEAFVTSKGMENNPDFASGYAVGSMIGGGFVVVEGLAEIVGAGVAEVGTEGVLTLPVLGAVADGTAKVTRGAAAIEAIVKGAVKASTGAYAGGLGILSMSSGGRSKGRLVASGGGRSEGQRSKGGSGRKSVDDAGPDKCVGNVCAVMKNDLQRDGPDTGYTTQELEREFDINFGRLDSGAPNVKVATPALAVPTIEKVTGLEVTNRRAPLNFRDATAEGRYAIFFGDSHVVYAKITPNKVSILDPGAGGWSSWSDFLQYAEKRPHRYGSDPSHDNRAFHFHEP
jgi:hypothetical protein